MSQHGAEVTPFTVGSHSCYCGWVADADTSNVPLSSEAVRALLMM